MTWLYTLNASHSHQQVSLPEIIVNFHWQLDLEFDRNKKATLVRGVGPLRLQLKFHLVTIPSNDVPCDSEYSGCTRRLDVVFALDASGSTEERFYLAQQANQGNHLRAQLRWKQNSSRCIDV